MKKSLIILTLAILQCACATQVDTRTAAPSLLSFAAISAEITIDYRESDAIFDSTDDLSQAVALNDGE